jgi:hypothetical protein
MFSTVSAVLLASTLPLLMVIFLLSADTIHTTSPLEVFQVLAPAGGPPISQRDTYVSVKYKDYDASNRKQMQQDACDNRCDICDNR